MYIFTSGTTGIIHRDIYELISILSMHWKMKIIKITGLPKAASMKHSRCFMMSSSCYYVSRLNPSDTVYTSLPLYHASGCLFGSCIALIHGPAQVVRKKFSASAFWKDCIKYKVTVWRNKVYIFHAF
jgi:acyl-CoA synthetase (AMP-forming)/AMP-acid ligase II